MLHLQHGGNQRESHLPSGDKSRFHSSTRGQDEQRTVLKQLWQGANHAYAALRGLSAQNRLSGILELLAANRAAQRRGTLRGS
jgi:hypothetical protein